MNVGTSGDNGNNGDNARAKSNVPHDKAEVIGGTGNNGTAGGSSYISFITNTGIGPIIQNNTYSSGGNGGNGGTGATSHADTSNSSSKPGEPGEQGNNKEITTDPNYINLLNNNAPNNGCVQIIWLYD